VEGAGIVISSTSEPKIEVKITLTSPVMRGVGASGDKGLGYFKIRHDHRTIIMMIRPINLRHFHTQVDI